MSIKRTFNGASLIHPGAYSKIVVENLSGFPLASTGTVGIIGEASGGEGRVLDILSKERIQDAKARYRSGPIADALELLVNPSKDRRIANGASRIIVYKVNNSTRSTVTHGTLKISSRNFGDEENSIEIEVAAAPTGDGRVLTIRKGSLEENSPELESTAAIVDWVNKNSSLAIAEATGTGVLAATPAPVPLAGADDGTAAANSDWAAAFEAMKEERVNIVVPLISADSGGATVDSINQLASAHAAWGWSTTGKSERSCFISRAGTKDDIKTAAQAIQSGMVSLFAQEPQVLDRQANTVFLPPWGLACIAAGMRAGAEVGEPLTYKYLNVTGLRSSDNDWNPKQDYSELIEAGVTIAESVDSGGFRWVVGNTTYGADASFVWNRESVVQAAGEVTYDLRSNLEQTFTGTKAKSGTAEAIANFIKVRMTTYLEAEMIVGDDLNEGLGYRGDTLRVNVEGNTASISVSITPVQGIDFILPTIYLADIRQSA